MGEELKGVFKKYKKLIFIPSDEQIVFVWGYDKKRCIPEERICIGKKGAPAPEISVTPYEVAKITYTPPKHLKEGLLIVVGTDGNIIATMHFKDKSNMKVADRFNECLNIYKKHNLGK